MFFQIFAIFIFDKIIKVIVLKHKNFSMFLQGGRVECEKQSCPSLQGMFMTSMVYEN